MWSSIVLDLRRALVVLAIGIGQAAAAAEPATIRDPVFGLSYRPASVVFDRLPSEVQVACPDLTTERWDRKAWVYGATQDGERRYFVIGGLFVQRSPVAYRPDRQGAVLVIEGGRCTLLGPASEVFETRPDTIPLAALMRLGRDVRARYDHAFRGRDAFEREVKRQHASTRTIDELVDGRAEDGSSTQP